MYIYDMRVSVTEMIFGKKKESVEDNVGIDRRAAQLPSGK